MKFAFARSVNIRLLAGLMALSVVLGLSATAVGQSFEGTLRGLVLDQTGAVVSGAKVTVTNQDTGVTATIPTSSAGTYSFGHLIPGKYSLRVEAPNFAQSENSGIRVDPGVIAEANATLKPGAVTEVVEVTAGGEAVNTVSSSITNTFEKVYDLPFGGGGGAPNVLDLALLTPNVTAVGGTAGSSVSVGGNRTRFNNYTIDGSDNNDLSTASRVQQVVPEAVEALVISSNLFSAEYGHSAGANFNVVTRTGTNTWHGTGYFYNQNRNYNAMTNIEKNTGDPSSPTGKRLSPLRYDQQRLGGNLGGPIIKNKVFIFGNYEWYNLGTTGTSTAACGPTAAGLTTLKALAVNPAVVSFLNNMPVAANTSADCAGATTGTGAFAALNTLPAGDVVANSPIFEVTKNYNLNGDVQNIGRNQLHFRYIQVDDKGPDQGAPFPSAQFLGLTTFAAKTAIARVVTTITPSFINEVVLQYQRRIQDIPVPSAFLTTPNVTIDDLGVVIGPNPNAPQSGAQGTYQIQDNMSYSVGKWNLKWGVEGRKAIGFAIFAQRVRGDYEWDTTQNFLSDIAPTVLRSREIGQPGAIGRFDYNLGAVYGYFQADVRVTPRFTLNLGLRYEWTDVPAGTEQNALNSISNFAGCTGCGPAAFNGGNLAPLNLWGRSKSDINNFSPRVGFAWDPTGKGKWSIRGGAQVTYDTFPLNFDLNEQPSQRSFLIFQTGGAPIPGLAGTPDCTGLIITPAPAWCTAPFNNFLALGGIPNAIPAISTQQAARAATTGAMSNYILPKVMEGSIGVQHEIWRQGSVEVRYQRTRGVSLPVQAQINAVSPFDMGFAGLPLYFSPSAVPATAAAGAPTLAQFNALKVFNHPYKFITLNGATDGFNSAITTFQPLANNTYNAVSVDYVQRSRWGLTGRASYTYSKNYDDATNELNVSGIAQRRPQDILRITQDWGLSALNISNKFTAGFNYDVPKTHSESGLMKGLLNNWQYGVTTIAQSGQSITPYPNSDANGNGDSAGDRASFNSAGTVRTGTAGQRTANLVCAGAGGATSIVTSTAGCAAGTAGIVGYVMGGGGASDPTQVYVSTPAGAVSNVKKGSLDSPGVFTWNMSLNKKVYFGERASLAFRVDAYNVFNHRNFSFAQLTQTGFSIPSASYSQTSSSTFLNSKTLNGGSRLLQLGLRFQF